MTDETQTPEIQELLSALSKLRTELEDSREVNRKLIENLTVKPVEAPKTSAKSIETFDDIVIEAMNKKIAY